MYKIDLNISVLNLINFLRRGGSINRNSDNLKDPNLLSAGIAAHQSFQKKQGRNYRTEIPLEYIFQKYVPLPLDSSANLPPDNYPDAPEALVADFDAPANTDSLVDADNFDLNAHDFGGFVKTAFFNLRILGRADGMWFANSIDDFSDCILGDIPLEFFNNFGTLIPVIDEIKSTYNDIKKYESPQPLHLEQALAYAYMYLKQHSSPIIAVRIVYLKLHSKTQKMFAFILAKEQVESNFQGILNDYISICNMQLKHALMRTQTLNALSFPFEPRPGQMDFVNDVYISILRNKNLFAQAPTGTGKTLSTLYPGLSALGKGYVKRIFYLTAKNITGNVAKTTADIIAKHISPKKYMSFKTVKLSGRDKSCINEVLDCTPENCSFASGHFDRVNAALFDMLENEHLMTEDVIGDYARKYMVCPYYLARRAAYFSDVIICDYNYAFNPDVCLDGFFTDPSSRPDIYDEIYSQLLKHEVQATYSDENTDGVAISNSAGNADGAAISNSAGNANGAAISEGSDSVGGGEYLFLVDEAHNLVERARDMYSARITYYELYAFYKIMKSIKSSAKIMDFTLASINSTLEYMLKIREETDFSYHDASLLDNDVWTTLTNYIASILTNLERLLSSHKIREKISALEKNKEFWDTYFLMDSFTYNYSLASKKYVFFAKPGYKNDIEFNIACMDPSQRLHEFLQTARTTVFFSATLMPVNFFREMLCTTPDNYAVDIPSPYNPDNLQVSIATDVSSRYTRRNKAEFKAISKHLLNFIREEKGNYIFFFPSFKMLSDIFAEFENLLYELDYFENIDEDNDIEELLIRHFVKNDDLKIFIQKSNMDEAARQQFLDSFEGDGETYTNSNKNELNNSSHGYKIGFFVLGGVFAEGIDLKGKSLIGVSIIGTGYPALDTLRSIYKDYFDKAGKRGFDYAYTYPGMIKVTQAAGRLIRTETDKGRLLLLDDRFTSPIFKRLFPTSWKDCKLVSLNHNS